MKIDHKNFNFEVKDIGADGLIQGYASVFNVIDFGMDLIEKGAFKKTIKEKKAKWPILYQHDPSKRIGYNIEAAEDDHGLLVTEKINLDSQLGKEEYSFAKMALDLKTDFGLSIGYATIKGENDKTNPGVRRLKELKMFEHSHVTFPMNDRAMITAAKAWQQNGDMGLNHYTDLFFKHMETIGFKHEEVKEALRKLAAADAPRDPNAKIIQSIDRALSVLQKA